jgi:sporulation protein YlmC with PRC-barrel domain
MEPMLNFISKFTNVVRSHIEETKEIIGKEVVDANANRAGICIDKIKIAFGAKFSMLGYQYSPEELKQIESINEDVLVCQGINNKKFFIPASEVLAVGQSVLLTKLNLNLPDTNGGLSRRKEEVFKKFFRTKESIKQFLPKVEEPKPTKKKKKPLAYFFH